MKTEEAEKLVCPFMDTATSKHTFTCITTKCMAWKNKEEFTEGKLRYVGEGYCIRLKNG